MQLRRQRRPALVALGLWLALGLGAAACGGSPDGNGVATLGGTGADADDRQTGGGPAKPAKKDPQEAALEFARCMREHGVDMPDPEVDSKGRIRVTVGGPAGKGRPQDPSKLNAAQQACGDLLGGGGDGPGRLDPKARDAMVDFARCMREHGIDMPDPSGDGLIFNRKRGQGPDPSSSKFKEAERACDHLLADLGAGERSTEERP